MLKRFDQPAMGSMTPGHQVTLAVSTATVTWWLMPRIARFKQQHPDIELRCITTDVDLDLNANASTWPLPWAAATLSSTPAGALVLQAALEGQGLALGWRHIVEPLIAQGRLVRPVPQSVSTDQPMYIVASRAGRVRSDVMALKDWLVQEASAAAPPMAR